MQPFQHYYFKTLNLRESQIVYLNKQRFFIISSNILSDVSVAVVISLTIQCKSV